MGNSSFGRFSASVIFPMQCSECIGTGKIGLEYLERELRDKKKELNSYRGVPSNRYGYYVHLQRAMAYRRQMVKTAERDVARIEAEIAKMREAPLGSVELETCGKCKGRPVTLMKYINSCTYNIMKGENDELVLQDETHRYSYHNLYNIKDDFSKIIINERKNTIILEAKPGVLLFIQDYLKGVLVEGDNYSLHAIKLRNVSKHQSDLLEKELKKPEYGINFVTREVDDRVASRRLLQENGRVHSVPATPLESILDEAGIPAAARRRLVAPSAIAAPGTPSVASYALLFSGLLFVGFLLGKCLRKRNCRRGPSIHDDDEGSL